MSDPFVAEIKMFGGNFAPRNYAFCDGSLLSISSYTTLFALLGTYFGGDGRSTFALPDLRGRFPMHFGSGPGLSTRNIGVSGGFEKVTLNQNEIPSHQHAIPVSSAVGNEKLPAGNVIAQSNDGENNFSSAGSDGAISTGNTGQTRAHENMPPFLAVNFIIALNGFFPSRS